MRKNAATSDNDWIRYFQRHLVPILFTFSNGDKKHRAIITAFVLSVADYWFLVTAGHCMVEIEENQQRGYKVIKTELIDSLGINAKHFEPVPFDFANAISSHAYDGYGFDYGLIFLRPYYRNLLEENGIKPLDEQVWKLQPKTVDFYFLLGVPFELTRITESNIQFTPTIHLVKKMDNKPNGFKDSQIPLFYGRIATDGLTDIGGMSGGPLFAFQENEKGELRYWLTALQSKWLSNSHIIAACPTKILGEFIESTLLNLAND